MALPQKAYWHETEASSTATTGTAKSLVCITNPRRHANHCLLHKLSNLGVSELSVGSKVTGMPSLTNYSAVGGELWLEARPLALPRSSTSKVPHKAVNPRQTCSSLQVRKRGTKAVKDFLDVGCCAWLVAVTLGSWFRHASPIFRHPP